MVRLFHITTVPQTLGFLRGQVGYMSAQGFDVHAISSPGERLTEFGQQEGIPVHAVIMSRSITPLRDIGALLRLWWVLRRIKPAIVHAHTPKGGLLGMLAARLAGVPVRIYHIHGLPLMTARGGKKLLLILSERLSCWCARRVLCVSPSIRQVAIDLGLCPAKKIAVLGAGTIDGIDAHGRFNPERLAVSTRCQTRCSWAIPVDASVIGFVGRIVFDKGVEDLVAAWTLLSPRVSHLYLVIAGEFECQDPISAETERILHTDAHIHLLGQVREMSLVYAAMDLLVLPTHREGFPYVPMEASAMALPVVATAVPGCVDAVVDGVTGTLVPPHDPEALAAAIARYVDDPDLCRQHGQAGRERVLRDFRPEDVWDATYREYVDLLTARGIEIPLPRAKEPNCG